MNVLLLAVGCAAAVWLLWLCFRSGSVAWVLFAVFANIALWSMLFRAVR